MSVKAEPWGAPPLIEGEWREMDWPDALAVMARYVAADREAAERVGGYRVVRARYRPLQSVADALLVEYCAIRAADERKGMGAFIYRPGEFRTITGASAVLHDFAERKLVRLDSADRALEYLRLFCACVQASAGCFYPWFDIIPVERNADHPKCSASLDAMETPPSCTGGPDTWTADMTVVYGGDMFRSRFDVKATGLIEMTDDRHLCGLESLSPQGWDGNLRFTGKADGLARANPCRLCDGAPDDTATQQTGAAA